MVQDAQRSASEDNRRRAQISELQQATMVLIQAMYGCATASGAGWVALGVQMAMGTTSRAVRT